MGQYEERQKRTQWFRDARFGMFIHWGLYAIPARGEWVRSNERLSNEDYEPFFAEFDPDRYDPRAWAKAARAAGMRYAVMTAKHHDGFCLFDSQLTGYKATNTKARRDLIREYLDAFRAEGLQVGLYYSLIDWHHLDYPAFADRNHPMRGNAAFRDRAHDFDRYLAYMHGQVRELCSNYGQIDILWFDYAYGDMTGEKWRATELVQMVRSLQPAVIIDNRLEASGEGYGSIKSREPSVYAGDFASPEQVIPPEGVTDDDGRPVPWEACITMNNHWGYCAADRAYKSPKQIIRKLVECVSKNGNVLLNVGPDAHGEIPAESLSTLQVIGAWMRRNGESIHDCGRAELPKPEWGYYTQKGDRLFAHIFDGNIGPLPLAGLCGRAASARVLADGSELRFLDAWNTKQFPDCLFINFGPVSEYTYPLPDDTDTVVEIRLRQDCQTPKSLKE